MRILTFIVTLLLTVVATAQENLQKQASGKNIKKTFTTVKGESNNQCEEPVSQWHLLGLRHTGVSGE